MSISGEGNSAELSWRGPFHGPWDKYLVGRKACEQNEHAS